MKREDVIWIAAYLEGEGCFLWQKSVSGGREYRYPLIVVGSTDLDVIQHAYRIMKSCKPFKAFKQRTPNHKQLWRTQVGGKKALEIMAVILPFMGKRRSDRIVEIMRLSALRPGQPHGSKCYQSKLGKEAVFEIRNSPNRLNRGFQAEMARKYHVNDGTIWYAYNGITWKPQHQN